MKIEMRQLDTLVPYENNPRVNDGAVAAVVASIREFGFRVPLVVDENGVIVCGHTRYKAAKKLGLTEVPCHVATDLTPDQLRAYRIADNKSAEIAEWDVERLTLELTQLADVDFDMSTLGFTEDEINGLVDGGTDGETDPDEVPEPPEEPITQPGDLWLLGDHRLLCGDSTKAEDVARVMDAAKAEMMFTDPPYGVSYEGGHFHSGDVNIVRKRDKLTSDDTADIYAAFLPVVLPFVDGPCYMWFAGSKALPVYQAVHDVGGHVSALLIWHKTNATYAAMNAQYKQRHEPLLYFKPKGSTLRWVGPTDACTLWEFKRDGRNDLHPTQKPVALAANALRNHKAASVLDAFCGSGSTIIAAEQLGRRCYAIEIDLNQARTQCQAESTSNDSSS